MLEGLIITAVIIMALGLLAAYLSAVSFIMDIVMRLFGMDTKDGEVSDREEMGPASIRQPGCGPHQISPKPAGQPRKLPE